MGWSWHSGRPSRRGYILIAFTLSLFFVLGMTGLAIDLGRMYTVKTEAQSFVDSAALDAAIKLDDTQLGVTRALAAVAANPKTWEFGTSAFTNVTTTFSTAPYGTFVASSSLPNPPTGYYFARVYTQVSLPLYLLPILVGSNASGIAASAVAGRAVIGSFTEGLLPFSPFGHQGLSGNTTGCATDPTDPFGLVIGAQYTFRWAAGNIDPTKPADLNKACSGDRCPAMLAVAAITTAERGYILLNSASSLRDSIEYDAGYYAPLTIGTSLLALNQGLPPGTKNTEMDALGVRVSQDTDSTSTEYGPTAALYPNSYKYRIDNQLSPYGNNRRVVVVPINSGSPTWTVSGFAGFFLSGTQHDYKTLGGNDPGCAEYIGIVPGGGPGPGSANEAYRLRLYQ